MDFLLLLILYCALFVVGSLCLLYRDSAFLSAGLLGNLRQSVIEVGPIYFKAPRECEVFGVCYEGSEPYFLNNFHQYVSTASHTLGDTLDLIISLLQNLDTVTKPVPYTDYHLIDYIERLVPNCLQNIASRVCHYLLYKRNVVFQLIFVVLCILAHAVWLVDMVPILYHHYPNYNHTFWPLLAVFINYFCWHKAWTGDPGEIKSTNCNEYMQVYQPDGVLYRENKICSTCKLKKPARSKHCSICNRCIHRFDHHCIWTNNCVGGLNHRFFILFMATLLAMFLQGIYVGTGCVLLYADDTRLFQASFLDEVGSVKPMTVSVAFHHLFMELPRLVFLIIALIVLSVLLSVFLVHHLFLIFTNQTNERHKLQEIKEICDSEEKDVIHNKRSKDTERTGFYVRHMTYRPYSNGIVSNFLEVFLPYNYITANKKK